MLTFLQRLLVVFAGVTLFALACMWILAGSGSGRLVAVCVAISASVLASLWINRHVQTQHDQFQSAFRDLRESLSSGRAARGLKSIRPPDSFGSLAQEINDLSRQTTSQVAGLLHSNQELEQTKTLFQSILGTMVEGVLVLDEESHILYFNSAARRLLACDSRDVTGRLLWEVVRETDLQEAVEAVYAEAAQYRREAEFKRSRSVVEVTAARLPLQQGTGVVVVLHDVTDLRRLERMRREFVSNVSHELKTPLTSIQAYADTLLDGGLEDADNSRRFVTRIIEQSARLQQLIQDMLRLARIESQSEAFDLQPVDAAGLLSQCVEAHREQAQANSLQLELSLVEPELLVQADPEGLRTIISNLISNAVHYTPSAGRIEVRGRKETGQAIIEVQDTGIGIGAEHRERIFERFYRVDKARSRGVGGTGLGLAIVKHLTQVFGGEIELESSPGRGSLFRIRLPLLAESSPATVAERTQSRHPENEF